MKNTNQSIDGAACAKNQHSGAPCMANARRCDYTERFIEEIQHKGLPAPAIALYIFLVANADSNDLTKPIKCPTMIIASNLSITKPTIISARQALCERGIIRFTKGVRRIKAPSYTLLPLPSETPSESPQKELAPQKELPPKANFSHTECKEKSIDELEIEFKQYSEWHDSLAKAISGLSKSDLPSMIEKFFGEERAKGVTLRDEADCKKHFFHWLKKENAKTRPKYDSMSRRTASDITARSVEDYFGNF